MIPQRRGVPRNPERGRRAARADVGARRDPNNNRPRGPARAGPGGPGPLNGPAPQPHLPGPAGLPPLPPGAVVAAADMPRRRGYVKATASWEPHVILDSPVHKYVKYVLSKEGKLVASVSASYHKIQAMERTLAIVNTLGYMYQRGARSVLNVYADERESKYNDAFNRELAPGETPMVILRYCPDVVHKDRLRNPTTEDWSLLLPRADTLLYVDIYAQHTTQTEVFDPHYVVRMLLSLPVPLNDAKLYWIGRKFYGDCGVVPPSTFMADPLKKETQHVWAEGAWLRKDGQIYFCSSPNEGCEYQHDPCDWIWKSTSMKVEVQGRIYTLSWSDCRPTGSFFTICFGLYAFDNRSNPSPWFSYDNNIIQLPVPADNLALSAVRSYIPTMFHSLLGLQKYLPVYTPYTRPVAEYFMSKRYAPHHKNEMTRRLQEGLSNQENRILFKCFPELDPSRDLELILEGLTNHSTVRRYYQLSDSTRTYGRWHMAVNSLMSGFGTTPLLKPESMSTPMLVVGGLLAGVGIIAYLRKFSTLPLLASVFQTYLSCRHEDKSLSVLFPTPKPRNWSNLIKTIKTYRSASAVQAAKIILPQINWKLIIATYFIHAGIAPLAEEFVKQHPVIRHLLPWSEFTFHVIRDHSIGNVVIRSTILYLHYWFVKPEDLQSRVVRHSAFNAASITYSLVTDPLAQRQIWKLGSAFATLSDIQYRLTNNRILKRVASIFERRRQPGFSRWDALYLTLIAAPLIWYSLDEMPIHKYLRKTQYEVWKEQYYDSDWVDRPVPTRDVPSLTCPITQSSTPRSPTSSVPTRPVDKEHCLTATGWLPEVDRAPTYFYHILPTCVPGYVPACTYSNLNSAISARMMVDPPLHPEKQYDAWIQLAIDGHYQSFIQVLTDQRGKKYKAMRDDMWEECVDEWLLHFVEPEKRRKYQKEVERIRQGFLTPFYIPKRTEIFLKSNEMLMHSKDGKMALKPRFISDVSVGFQTQLGPFVYKAQKRMSKTCPPSGCGRSYDEKLNCFFSLSYGGSALDTCLSDWMNDVVERRLCPPGENGISVIVCGDDSYVAIYYGDTIEWHETDFKKYDSTQGKGPLLFQRECGKDFYGLTAMQAMRLFVVCGSKRVVYAKHLPDHTGYFMVDCLRRFHRHSGSLDTSFGNSNNTMFAWYVAYRTTRPAEGQPRPGKFEYQEAFLKLGFETTFQTHQHPDQGTFLKGMWYLSRGRYIWAPLPSRILKAGKSLRDPREIYGTKDFEKACGLFLNGVASTYAVYLQVPIMRAFVARYSTNTKDCQHLSGLEFNPYTTVASGAYCRDPLDAEAMVAVCERYRVTEDDILRAEHLILNSNPLTFLSDPVFVALWESDYT